MARSISVSKILKAISDARAVDVRLPHLCVVGNGDDLARVVLALSAGAAGEHTGHALALDALSPADFPADPRLAAVWTMIVIVAPGCSSAEAGTVVRTARKADLDVVAYVEGPAEAWALEAGVYANEMARSVGDGGGGSPSLENRIVHAAGEGAALLASVLPAVRRAYCEHVVLVNAAQNGAIGAVVIIPGADMPAMTANQIRMVLKIAAAYGEKLDVDRALEILSVVGSAFVFRALARQALDFVPGFGWALKGAFGFSATVALGQAAIAYFEAGAPLRVSRMQRVSSVVERARSRLPDFLQRGGAQG